MAKSPDTSSCPFIDYWDPGTTWSWIYSLAGSAMGTETAMRFDAAEQDGHVCEVYGIWPWIRSNENSDTSTAGMASMVVKVYLDNGGVPGDLLYQETFPVAEIHYGEGDYFPMYFTGGTGSGGAVEVPEGVFHISLSGSGGDGTSMLYIYSDDGGPGCIHPSALIPGTATPSGRASRYLYDSGTDTWDWYGGTAAFSCGDRNFDFYVDYCYWHSDCYSINPLPSPYYTWSWQMPDPAWGDGSVWYGAGQIFSLVADTLAIVRVNHLDYSDDDATEYWPAAGTRDMVVEVWKDDGTGEIDEVYGPIATETFTGTRADYFPQTGGDLVADPGDWNYIYIDFRSHNLLLSGMYHITIKFPDADNTKGIMWTPLSFEHPAYCPGPYCTDGTGGSVLFTPPGDSWARMTSSEPWATEAGFDMAYYIRPYFCVDEFAECKSINMVDFADLDNLITDIWYMGTVAQKAAQKFVGTDVNRVQTIRFQLWDDTPWGDPYGSNGLPPIEVAVYSSIQVGTANSTIAWADTLDGGDINYYPGWNEVVIPGGYQIVGDWYAGVSNASTDLVNTWIYFPASDVNPEINDGMVYLRGTTGLWTDMGDRQERDQNLVIGCDFCSIPVEETVCWVEDDWPTFGHDQARTGHSGVGVGDAYCDLTLNWHYHAPGKGIAFCAPIIYDGKVVCSYGDEYRIIDLTDGSLLGTLTGTANGIGAASRCTPTIATIGDGAGGTKDVLFVAGGSTRNVSAFEFVAPYDVTTRMWTSEFGNYNTTYGGLIVLNVGGTDVLFWSTISGYVYATNALDGTPFTGWVTAGNYPVVLGLNLLNTGTSDGQNLYYGTFDSDGGVNLGDLYKIDAATGDILWTVITVNGDLMADDIYATVHDTLGVHAEGFYSVFAYDADLDVLWAQTALYGCGHPAEGVFYQIDAETGEFVTAAASQNTRFSSPLIDAKRVIVPTAATFFWAPLGNEMLAFRRPQGDLSWVSGGPVNVADCGKYWAQAALTCEVGAPDLIFAFDNSHSDYVSAGFFSCLDANTGDELFRRRIDHGAKTYNRGMGTSIGRDDDETVHVVTTDIHGEMYDFTKGVDRPRLEIQAYSVEASCEFGTDPNFHIVVDNILYNSGCADLNIWSVSYDTIGAEGTLFPDFTATNTTVRPEVIDRATEIAKQLLSVKSRDFETSSIDDDSFDQFLVAGEKDRPRMAAAGPLDFLVSVSVPSVIAPLDSGDVDIYVDQTIITRGAHQFCIYFDTDDPDFFLNNQLLHDDTLLPRIGVTVVGGCLIDTVTMNFGVGGANMQWVANTARLGQGGEWDPNGIEIDGDGDSYFAGGYIYGVSKYRIAMNIQDWTQGGTEAEGFHSLQADPNWCDGDCAPYLTAVASLGEYSSDGFTYTPVAGNMVCRTYIDSVQSFYDPGELPVDDGWTWENGWEIDGRLDDTLTIGLMTTSRVFGALDIPGLANFTLDVMDITERNGDSVTGWYMGSMNDYDIGDDIPNFDASISAGWASAPAGAGAAWGQIMIPFGCGLEPERGVQATYGYEGLWNETYYYDSAYFFLSTRTGVNDHPNT
ncbi:MAG: hypothetical protein OEW00_12775, partial [candidate division Zixibacteria bacterium]|nr:hypothetical protein [candidate division Zixibacteria bacterium]